MFRFAGRAVLRCVEKRKVLPDDLIGPVAFDPFGAVIPGRDVSRGVEHEDGVVLHAVDQQAEHLLAAAQLLLAFAMKGHVAGDLPEPDQNSLFVANRVDDRVRPEARTVLANAPAFVLDPAVLRRVRKLALRLLIFQILRTVEEREVLSHRLLLFVAHDPFGAGIPGTHLANGAEQKHRVIRDITGEKGELLRRAREVGALCGHCWTRFPC